MHVELLDRTVELDAERVEAPADEIRAQIAEYAAGERRAFDLPVALPSGFAGEVAAEMRAIPYGETRTYGEVADDLDTAAVAVGRACGTNPVPLVVPCHRVVGADSLGGYSAGDGLPFKRRLLELEGASVGREGCGQSDGRA
jgi:methylated-DNA-[protein]-cysteine S-methyltransferase